MGILDIGQIGLGAIRKITELIRAGKAESLIDYTRPARVEPIAMISSDLLSYDGLPTIMQSALSMWAGYYIQGFDLMARVGNVNVRTQLDRLNPNRSVSDAALNTAGWLLAQESYEDGLPTVNRRRSMEALLDEDVETTCIGLSRKETLSALRDLTDLSIGKLFEVEIIDGNQRITVPVSIRLIASTMSSASMVHILTMGDKELTAVERMYGYRSGRLEFIRDIIMMNDLVKEHRKNLMKDVDGLYSEIVKRRRGNQLSSIISGNPSVGTITNIALITAEQAAEVEAMLGGRLKDMATREKAISETSIMILGVVDRDYDRVTFYHQGIRIPTEVSIKDMARSNSSNHGSGPNVAEILKAYQRAEAPSL